MATTEPKSATPREPQDHPLSATIRGTSRVTAKLNRETWLDGLPDDVRDTPPDELYTREEVLGLLGDRGIDVNEVTLVFWEKSGILPRPVRRRRDGAPRALYPPWAVDAIAHLRDLQAQGRSLEQIAPLMRSWKLTAVEATDRATLRVLEHAVVWKDPGFGPMNDARTTLLALGQALGLDVLRIEGITVTYHDNGDHPMHEETLTVPYELRQSVRRRHVAE